jgi:hypothetical protein
MELALKRKRLNSLLTGIRKKQEFSIEANMDKINQIKKEIFISMKMMDTIIKGIKELEEYKIAQAYNQGLRDAMGIFEREMKQ